MSCPTFPPVLALSADLYSLLLEEGWNLTLLRNEIFGSKNRGHKWQDRAEVVKRESCQFLEMLKARMEGENVKRNAKQMLK